MTPQISYPHRWYCSRILVAWAAFFSLHIHGAKAGTFSIETLTGIMSGPIQEFGEPIVASPDCLGVRFLPNLSLSTESGESQQYSVTPLFIEYIGTSIFGYEPLVVTIRGHYEILGQSSEVDFDASIELNDVVYSTSTTAALDESDVQFPINGEDSANVLGDFEIDQNVLMYPFIIEEDFDITLSMSLSADAPTDGSASITVDEIILRPILFLGASNPVPGDINRDYRLDLMDIDQLTNYLLGSEQLPKYWESLFDLNSDGQLNGLDIQVLTDLLTNDCSD